jgi:hypothetical protein
LKYRRRKERCFVYMLNLRDKTGGFNFIQEDNNRWGRDK